MQMHVNQRMRILAVWVLMLTLNGAGNALWGQKSSGESLRDTSLKLRGDDPIVAALDSLAFLKLFESGGKIAPEMRKGPTEGMTADSVPIYDNAIIEERITKLDEQSPFKLVYNSEVMAYINMYAVRKRAQVSKMLGLAELYFPMFEEALARHKMPLELKHLAIIESALNPAARSRVGAQGLWQFMYGTGKMFNLEVNSYIDERCDPIKSTDAACRYMKYLYSIYKDWSLVLAAYNSGPGNVNKAIRRSGGKTDYWDLRPFLPKETAGYVPAFIAATYVMSYANEHNLHPTMPKAVYSNVDTLHVRKKLQFTQLSKILDMPIEDIEFLNPTYLLGVVPQTDHHHVLTLPKDKIATFINNEDVIYTYVPPKKEEPQKDTAAAANSANSAAATVKTHLVKSGESITTIARRYGVTVADIKKWNRLASNKLKRGQRIKVSAPYKEKAEKVMAQTNTVTKEKSDSGGEIKEEVTPEPAPEKKTSPAPKPAKNYSIYKVRRGDSLWKIAASHGMTLDEIRKLNGFSSSAKIKVGQQIKVKKK